MNYQDLVLGKNREWIICNGLGGYASSTVTGANTRKYHGLLVASLNPPVKRRVLLSSLDEELILGDEIYRLAVHEYSGAIYPHGHEYLTKFSTEYYPVFEYQAGDFRIKKQLTMVPGENTTVIRYEIDNLSGKKGVFRILPLVNNRSVHGLSRSDELVFSQKAGNNGTLLNSEGISFCIGSDMHYRAEEHWYYDFRYSAEISRGYPGTEDNFNPGCFELEINRKKTSCFIITSVDIETKRNMKDVSRIFNAEKTRQKKLLGQVPADTGKNPLLSRLIITGDSFIVDRKSTGAKSVIAGYHWFGDWGRDTMISVPGLTLASGRFADAKSILSTFSAYCRNGLMPNSFPENPADSPIYNTVDASLWFIHAAGRYLDYTADSAFIEKIWPTVENITGHYEKGTDFGIRMDADGLIENEGQLTWMDVRIGDWEVTPRRGRACDINALWYNALMYAAKMGEMLDRDVSGLYELAERSAENYPEKFWNDDSKCLYDCISKSGEGEWKDASVRPNQIFAVSLPHTILGHGMEKSILDVVSEKLLTPCGLRTLSPDDARYRGKYEGNTVERDTAYHNGTVWPWLLGPYITAYRKVYHDAPDLQDRLRGFLRGIESHMDDAGLNTISEVFDGDIPHKPGGCISQAWSVAEITRCYIENISGGN